MHQSRNRRSFDAKSVAPVGILAWYLFSPRQSIAQAIVPAEHTSIEPTLAPKVSLEIPSAKALPNEAGNPQAANSQAPNAQARTHKPKSNASSPSRLPPPKPTDASAGNKTTKSGDLSYDFIESSQYTYRFDLEFELAKTKHSVAGSNFLKKLPVGDLPIVVTDNMGVSGVKGSGGNKQVIESSCYLHIESDTGDYGSYSPVQHADATTTIALDAAGQPMASDEKLKENLMPLMMMPLERQGIEELPQAGQTQWQTVQKIISVSQKAPVEPHDPYGGDPYGGDPYGGYSRLPGLSRHFRRMSDPLYEAESPETVVTTYSQTVFYKIESNDDQQVRVAKTISIKPESSTSEGEKQTIEIAGHYVFDKQKNCVVKTEMSGIATIEMDNISLKIPLTYTCELDSIKTKADLASDAKKRKADAEKKRNQNSRFNAKSGLADEDLDSDLADNSGNMTNNDANNDLDDSTSVIGSDEGDASGDEGGGRIPNEMVAIFEDMGWGVQSLSFSPKGMLYAGKMDRAVLAFDVTKRRKIDDHQDLEELGQVKICQTTPNGKLLLSGGYKGPIGIWKIDNSGQIKPAAEFVGHSEEVLTIAVSPDSKIAISGGGDKRVRIWDLKTQKELATFDGFEREVLGALITPDGKFAYASDGTRLMKIDMTEFKMVSNPKVCDSYCHAAAFSPDGKMLAVSEGYNTLMFDTSSFAQIRELKGPSDVHYALNFSPDGKYLFAGGGHVTQWDWDKARKVNEFHVSDYTTIKTIAITDDGKFLATIGSSAGQNLKVFKIRDVN